MKTLISVLLAAIALSGCVVVPAYPYGYGYYDRGHSYYGPPRYRSWDRY